MIFAAVLLLPSVVRLSPHVGHAPRPCVRHAPVRAAEAASEAEMVGEWELEEREDALSAFTLIELHAGGGVDVKATSGPPPARADGRWAISPDGETIVTGAGDETLRFWNVFPGAKSKGRCVRTCMRTRVRMRGCAAAIFPSGKTYSRAVTHMLHVACCMLHVACRMLHVARRMSHLPHCDH